MWFFRLEYYVIAAVQTLQRDNGLVWSCKKMWEKMMDRSEAKHISVVNLNTVWFMKHGVVYNLLHKKNHFLDYASPRPGTFTKQSVGIFKNVNLYFRNILSCIENLKTENANYSKSATELRKTSLESRACCSHKKYHRWFVTRLSVTVTSTSNETRGKLQYKGLYAGVYWILPHWSCSWRLREC